jgi:hypothetical protein
MHPLAPTNCPPQPLVQPYEWRRAEASLEMARCTRQPLRLSEALAELGRCERRSGAPDGAGRRFDEALHWARAAGSVDLLADLLCERGELAADVALDALAPGNDPDPDAWLLARACAIEAAGLAAYTSDPGWEVQVLLRASDLFNRLGNPISATALQSRALRRMGASPRHERPPTVAVEPESQPTLQ